jgi:hypothetical protein
VQQGGGARLGEAFGAGQRGLPHGDPVVPVTAPVEERVQAPGELPRLPVEARLGGQ